MPPITLWGVGALYFSPLLAARWRAVAAASYGAATVLAFALLPDQGRTAIATLAVFAILVILFLRTRASNDRDSHNGQAGRRPAWFGGTKLSGRMMWGAICQRI